MSGPGAAAVWFRWDGFAELLDSFATLAPDLTAATAPEVESAAQEAKQTIAAGYPARTGNLRLGLGVVMATEETRAKATVVNVSPHAVIYERGSQARHTAIGANRGSMPPDPIFSATLIRERRRLYAGPVSRVLTTFGLRADGNA